MNNSCEFYKTLENSSIPQNAISALCELYKNEENLARQSIYTWGYEQNTGTANKIVAYANYKYHRHRAMMLMEILQHIAPEKYEELLEWKADQDTVDNNPCGAGHR